MQNISYTFHFGTDHKICRSLTHRPFSQGLAPECPIHFVCLYFSGVVGWVWIPFFSFSTIILAMWCAIYTCTFMYARIFCSLFRLEQMRRMEVSRTKLKMRVFYNDREVSTTKEWCVGGVWMCVCTCACVCVCVHIRPGGVPDKLRVFPADES